MKSCVFWSHNGDSIICKRDGSRRRCCKESCPHYRYSLLCKIKNWFVRVRK